MEPKERRKLKKVLTRLMDRGRFVTLDRKPLDPFKLEGFIVGVSNRLVMLHVVDGSTLDFNGYAAVRLRDLQSVATKPSFVPRALKLLGRHAVRPHGLDLTGWPELLATAAEQFPLIWLALEKQHPGCGYPGKLKKLTKRSVHLRYADPQARWDGIEKYALQHITQVNLGDGYVNGLWAVLEHSKAPARDDR